MTLLEARNLRKTYPLSRRWYGAVADEHIAVDDVSFDIGEGETLAVVGESGAGKSTLGRLILRLVEADAGEIHMGDTDVRALRGADLRKYRRNAQIIFQDPYACLDPRCTIEDAVSEPLLVQFGMPRDERRAKAAELLEIVGLGRQYLDRYPGEMSGGQLQRVAIARALSLQPKLVVCDEPVAALDLSIRAQVLKLMQELQRELRLSYFFVTHDLSLVEVIAQRDMVMRSGPLVEQGTVAELFDNPRE